MILYTPVITPRLQFIVEFIGNELLGKPFSVVTNREEFQHLTTPRINYSDQRLSENEIWIQPQSLLFEKDIRQQEIRCFEYANQTVFFQTAGDLPFDIFAASFYLISRYEEYLPHVKDKYGRFDHGGSLAFKEGFLQQPLINVWLVELRKIIEQRFPGVVLARPVFKFLPTYDIDEAWSYKYKTTARRLGASIKNILQGQWSLISQRKKVRSGQSPDPFDSYAWMDALHESAGLKPHYFFLVPAKTGKYDRNILPGETALQQLIKEHAEKYPVGLHPSWQSGDSPVLLKEEMDRLESITVKPVIYSRQHFIRFTLPTTYRQLLAAGITMDFSMGYGSINGFRASVASPFNWYDLEKEELTSLRIMPFCFMDANAFFEEKLTPAQAMEEMLMYYKIVKEVNGTFTCIWHNTFLGTGKLFTGWREVYKEFIRATV